MDSVKSYPHPFLFAFPILPFPSPTPLSSLLLLSSVILIQVMELLSVSDGVKKNVFK